ncbi:hypothetical protein [Ruminococcus sp.]|uniref:hypothetical protein n=1 Tax=Ruminococcus sp. TaxID=41978 RepID=UPI0025E09A89|nr:hypothetical protein [Ruminococcus sp.]MCR4640134.1 hypothetical protein [Ruminococcus sp.]
MITNREERNNKLRKLATDVKTAQLIEEMITLEDQLDILKQKDFYKENPKNKAQIKVSPAFYAYHKCLSAYKECIKLLVATTGSGETSPLREYLKSLREKQE